MAFDCLFQVLGRFDDSICRSDGGERLGAAHGFVGRHLRILGAGAHHVEGDFALSKDLAPVRQAVGGCSS